MASTVPVALANLAAALKGAGLPAYDGPTVSNASLSEVVVVGFSGADDPTAVEVASAVEGLSVTPEREQYTIRNAVMVTRGGGDIVAARTRAYELLNQVADVLAADPTLGGAVMIAYLSDHTLLQQQTGAGAAVTLTFGVACDAYTSR